MNTLSEGILYESFWKPTPAKLIVHTNTAIPHGTKQILMVFLPVYRPTDVSIRSFNIANLINFRSGLINTSDTHPVSSNGELLQTSFYHGHGLVLQTIHHEYASDDFLRALKLLWMDEKFTFEEWVQWVNIQHQGLLESTELERLRAML